MSIRDIVQGSDTKASRAFDSVVFVLIISSIIALTFETLPDLSPAAKRNCLNLSLRYESTGRNNPAGEVGTAPGLASEGGKSAVLRAKTPFICRIWGRNAALFPAL